MPSKPYLKFSLPLAIALAALMLVLTTFSALADGPIINVGTSTPAISTFFGPTASGKTGQSLATGDINGDGREDLLIGAPYANLTPLAPGCSPSIECTSGAVYLYLGRPGISQTFDLASYKPNVTFYVRPDQENGEELGRSLATGDINGDNLDDIIMGVSRYEDGDWHGATLAWVGRTSITTTSAISVELYGTNDLPGPSGGYNLKIVAAGSFDFGSWDVASGDVNNDGLDDIIIGTPGVSSSPTTNTTTFHPPDFKQYHFSASPSRTFNGAAYVWLGRNSLTASSQRVDDLLVCLPEMTIYGRTTESWLGTAVATGDLDGDGYDDIIAGAPGFNNNSGLLYVFYGTDLNYATCSPSFQNWVVKDLMTTTANITLSGVTGTRIGTSYDLSVGNLNNDAFEDLIIAAPFNNDGPLGTGQVYVVYGRSRAEFSATPNINLLTQADVTVHGGVQSWMGASVLAADVNNDNTDDLIIGSPDVDPDHGDIPGTENSLTSGKVHVLYGGSLSGNIDLSNNDDAADLTLIGAFPDDWLGRGLAVADLNLDGSNELIAGAAAFDYSGRNDAGAVHVVNLVYPQLSVTPSLTQVVAGSSVSFTSAAYTWLNGSTNVTPDTTFAISPAAGGSWNGNIYQTANFGTWTVTATYNTQTATTTITVLQPAVAAFVCVPSCTRNENQSVDFNASGSSGVIPLSYAWNFGDGATDNGTVTNHIYPDNGVYTVTLTVEGANGATDTATRLVTITNLPPAIQSVTNTGPITPGRSVTVTVTASDVPSDTLAYTFDCDNNGTFETTPPGNQAACFFGSSGTFTVTARVTDGDGGSALGTTLVTVFPVAAFTCNPPSCTRNENQLLAFNGSSSVGTGLAYSWNFGDGDSGSGANVNHTYDDNDVYIVTLTVQDTKGLTASVTRPVTISNVAPVIQSVTNSGPANPDEPVTITVTASDAPGDPLAYAFDCDNNGGFEIGPQGSNQAACEFSTEGVFTVTVRVTDGDGGSAQGTTLVTVSSDPVAAFICGTCSTDEAQPLAFEAADSPGKAPLSYNWSFGDGASGSGLTLTHTYADNGIYTVILTVEAADGLTSTVSRPITVTNLAPIIQSMTNSGPIVAGNAVTITVTATDIAADTLAYAFDCDNNGVFEIGPQAGNKTSCPFSAPGTFTVKARVTDEDGGSAEKTTSVSVSAPAEPTFKVLLPLILK